MTSWEKQMFTIEEFMTSEPYTLRDSDSIDDAIKVMVEKHIRHIPITDDDDHLLGLVTQTDVLSVAPPSRVKGDKSDIRISDVMIRNVSVIHKADSLRQAAVYLQSHKYGCLPVISDDQVVGIITDSDFVEIAINMLEQAEQLDDEI